MGAEIKATQITWHEGAVTAGERARLLKQKGCTLWFTGLSGSGKSTLAVALEQVLFQLGHASYVLDGDNVRFGLNASPKTLVETRGYSETTANRFGLTFSAEDRVENIRRIGEVVRLFADAGLIAITSFISPYRKDREAARAIHEKNKAGAIPFIEIHVCTAIDVCESRDPKGLYKQARATIASGKGAGFTGIDDPYETPDHPELTIDTGKVTTQEGVALVLNYLKRQGLVG
ncbi:adenylyl-sulfate kinase [Zavarzinella formosa]|uniref:adenylyl-sulfate kinase n=1 Tax=Zavarzinella formosa TaxID=360055 RepID=UPI0003127628|nr:adenylyl-sulfate kinase [Zavarzinella formosa]